ncbi:MAG: hypothetical protein ACRCTZ_21930 [Sarcina sp.]
MELFICKKCGNKMEYCENGESAPCDEEWLECNSCVEIRDLDDDEIDYILNRRFGY